MIFEIYKMYPQIFKDKVFLGNTPAELIATIETEELFHSYVHHHNLDISPDEYYVVDKSRNEYYVLWYQNGWYCDSATDMDRLVIATELDLTPKQARIVQEKDELGTTFQYEQLSAKQRLAKIFPDYF